MVSDRLTSVIDTFVTENVKLKHRYFDPSFPEHPTNDRINLIGLLPETKVVGLHPCRLYMRLSSSYFRGGLRKTHVLCNRMMLNGTSRSSKVVDFGTNRKRVCNFLLVINRNFILPCSISEILQVFC